MKRFQFQPTREATIVTIMCALILFALGTWQTQRLIWKTDLLNTIETRMREDILIFPQDITDVDSLAYTKGALRGRFLHEHEYYVQPRRYQGWIGFHVLTPFERVGGAGIVLVNRGFAREENMVLLDRPTGQIILNGILHVPDDRNRFTPMNEKGHRYIYATDMRFIEQETGLNFSTPMVLYATDTRGTPVGGQLNLDIANNHLEYAFFWYTMFIMIWIFYFSYFVTPIEKGAHENSSKSKTQNKKTPQKTKKVVKKRSRKKKSVTK